MRVLTRLLVLAVVAAIPCAAAVAADVDAKALYGAKCAMCHGADGVAKPMAVKLGAKNFTDAAFQKEKSDADLTKAITDGVPEKKMPAYKDKLKAEEITALVKHIRGFAPAK